MNIITCKNYDKMSEESAKIVIDLVHKKPSAVLGLATGSTPIGLYEHIVKAYKNNLVSFKDIKTYNLDEYVGIQQDNPQSYYRFMYHHLFNHVDIKEENIHMPYSRVNFEKEDCNSYNQELHNTKRDLQILGIGINGHIGFNEPGTAFDQETFVVTLAKETIEANARFFDTVRDVPTKAMTMGIKNIKDAEMIILMASGKEKAQAIHDLVHAEVDINKPQTSLQNHPNLIVICDEDAASLL